MVWSRCSWSYFLNSDDEVSIFVRFEILILTFLRFWSETYVGDLDILTLSTIPWLWISGNRGLSPCYSIMSDVWLLSHSLSREQRGCSECSRAWCMGLLCVTLSRSSTQEICVLLCGAASGLQRVLSATYLTLFPFFLVWCAFYVYIIYIYPEGLL